MAIYTNSPHFKAVNEQLDKDLEEFIMKMNSKPVPPIEQYISQEFKHEFLVGYYIKHANTVDKRLANNPNQKNYLCMFYDWVKQPSRILKHYGFGSKIDDHLLLRKGHPLEIEKCKGSSRMLRRCIYNWNDAIEYHIRLGLPVSPLVGMSEDYELDGLKVNLKQAAQASMLPIGTFNHKPHTNNNQHQLLL